MPQQISIELIHTVETLRQRLVSRVVALSHSKDPAEQEQVLLAALHAPDSRPTMTDQILKINELCDTVSHLALADRHIEAVYVIGIYGLHEHPMVREVAGAKLDEILESYASTSTTLSEQNAAAWQAHVAEPNRWEPRFPPG